jgi:hypothetical protein
LSRFDDFMGITPRRIGRSTEPYFKDAHGVKFVHAAPDALRHPLAQPVDDLGHGNPLPAERAAEIC